MYRRIDRSEKNRITVRIQGEDNIAKFNKLLDEEYKDIRLADTREADGIQTFELDLPDEEADHIKGWPQSRPWKPSATESISSGSVNPISATRVKNGF